MYSKSIALFLMSLSLVVLCLVIFINAFSFDCLVIKYTLLRVLPCSLILGLLGFLIGRILDYANYKK